MDSEVAELKRVVAEQAAMIAAQADQIRQLTVLVEDLRAQLNRNSSNSSTPPSANPPGAPKASGKKPGGRKPGGQPGHRGHHRAKANPDLVREHRPARCRRCQSVFTGNEPVVGRPIRHQVTEIPPIRPVVTEHQLHRVRCSCGCSTRATLPEGVPAGHFGTRAVALAALLSGRYRITRRELVALFRDAFSLELSVGSAQALCELASKALEQPYEDIRRQVLTEPVVHPDETGWRNKGKKAWLWVVSGRKGAVFKIHKGRGHEARRTLLPDDYRGIVTSDRWAAYRNFEHRQICHAHLLRDWKAVAEREHPGAQAVGAWGVRETKRLLKLGQELREGELTQPAFGARMRLAKARYARLLNQAEDCGDRKARTLADELNKLWDHLWTFVASPGVEPTNNRAEREIRPAVLWRKGSFGTWSESGQRFVERSLTVAATARMQGVRLFAFIHSACDATLKHRPVPSIFGYMEPAPVN